MKDEFPKTITIGGKIYMYIQVLLVIVLFTYNIFYLQQLFHSSELVSLLGIICLIATVIGLRLCHIAISKTRVLHNCFCPPCDSIDEYISKLTIDEVYEYDKISLTFTAFFIVMSVLFFCRFIMGDVDKANLDLIQAFFMLFFAYLNYSEIKKHKSLLIIMAIDDKIKDDELSMLSGKEIHTNSEKRMKGE